MQLYEVSDACSKRAYRCTLSEAHARAKLSPKRQDVRVRLFDYPDDKSSLCDLFNGKELTGPLKRAWALTARGGLMELPLDKAMREVEDEREL